MGIIARISLGSKMDQIYLPKNRFGLKPGSYVLVKELSHAHEKEKLFLYNIKKIEKIKIIIIEQIFKTLSNYDFENIIITGSFLEEGFNFNDMDIILICNENIDIETIRNELKEHIGVYPLV